MLRSAVKCASGRPDGIISMNQGSTRLFSCAPLWGIFMLARYGLFDRPQAFRGPSRVWFGAHAASRINECVRELALRPQLSVSYVGKSWAGRSRGH